jgi:hypothetical protein
VQHATRNIARHGIWRSMTCDMQHATRREQQTCSCRPLRRLRPRLRRGRA